MSSTGGHRDSVFTVEINDSVTGPNDPLKQQKQSHLDSNTHQTMWRRRKAVRAKRPSRIISTGEAPGFLHRRLNYITKPSGRPLPRPRVYTTPQSELSTVPERTADSSHSTSSNSKPQPTSKLVNNRQ